MNIIPNWHPIFVHFPIALITISLLFFITSRLLQMGKTNQGLLLAGYWCLWAGTLMAVFAGATGLYAYLTVEHTSVSHLVMNTHRDWAFGAFAMMLIMTLWSIRYYRSNRQPPVVFLLGLLITVVLISITAWYGTELVYRHGTGMIKPSEPHHGEHHAH